MLRNTNRKIASAAASRSSCAQFSTSAKREPAASSVVSTRPRRQLLDHVGNVDERMVGVPVGEQALIVGFDAVVELLDEPRAQLFDQRPGFETRKEQSERTEHHVGIDEIGADRLVDAGVLDLDRHRAGLSASPRDAPARSTPPRSASGPIRANTRLGRVAELLAHDLRGQLGCHRRRILLQRRERLAHRLRQPVVEIARHLAELHERALQLAEHAGDIGRRCVSGARRRAPSCARATAVARRTRWTAWRVPVRTADRGQAPVARRDGVANEPGTPPRAAPRDATTATAERRGQDRGRRGAHVATVAAGHYT